MFGIKVIFSSVNDIKNNADLGEKIGKIGLGLLRIGFGKTVTIEEISNKINVTEKMYSTKARVAAIITFVFAFPITVPLAGLGCLGIIFSKTYKQNFNLYCQYKQIPIIRLKTDHVDAVNPSVSDCTSIIYVTPILTCKP